MTILITRLRHDEGNNYLFHWSRPVVELAEKRGFRLVDLSGNKANRKLLWQYCKKLQPGLMFLNGHGSPGIITGHNDEVLIQIGDRLSDFANRAFYCRSCDSAALLGPSLISSGAKFFIGYVRKFIFGYMPEFMTRPLKDPLAKLFLEPSNLVVSSLVKGNTAIDAYRKSQYAMRANLRKMLSSQASFEERYHAFFLWSNIKNQVLLGKPQGRII